MDKNFDKWNSLKKDIEFKQKRRLHIRPKEIYFISIGQNIGSEVYGKSKEFLRPVIVYKKLSKTSFIGIPLTSKPKDGSYFFQFSYKSNMISTALLNQIRVFDSKRVVYYSGNINQNYFKLLEEKIVDFMKVTPNKKGGGISQKRQRIVKNIISQKNNNVNILITGVNGQLGSEIRALSLNYNYNYYFTTKDELDITNINEIEEFVQSHSITNIINCGAYTAVDKAESDIKIADKINHLGVKYLAQISKKYNISLIHISTDYVFDGKNYKPYIEDDKTNPNSVYGKTKLDGENAIKHINPKNSIIIRTSWVYSSYGNNFVKTMLKLGRERDSLNVIFDQVGTPTYARDLAKVILDILPQIKSDKVEIYNYSNEGVLSWYNFAKEIMKMAKIDCEISPIETKDYPTPASRPHYSLLNKSKIKKDFNIEIPFWKDSLNDCLITLGERK